MVGGGYPGWWVVPGTGCRVQGVPVLGAGCTCTGPCLTLLLGHALPYYWAMPYPLLGHALPLYWAMPYPLLGHALPHYWAMPYPLLGHALPHYWAMPYPTVDFLTQQWISLTNSGFPVLLIY